MRGLESLEIDARGLDKVDREILRTLVEKYGGGPVGSETIAISDRGVGGHAGRCVRAVSHPDRVSQAHAPGTGGNQRRMGAPRASSARDVKTSQFSFDLPESLIAQSPPADREAARLLVLDRASGSHPALVREGSGRLDRARNRRRSQRLACPKSPYLRYPAAEAASTEFLLLQRRGPDLWETIAGRVGRLKTGSVFTFAEGVIATARTPGTGNDRILRFDPPIDEAWLERNGHVPLPPYIRRPDQAADEDRYQTVYARALGSAAAPTAGLHFTDHLLQELEGRGVRVWRG